MHIIHPSNQSYRPLAGFGRSHMKMPLLLAVTTSTSTNVGYFIEEIIRLHNKGKTALKRKSTGVFRLLTPVVQEP